MGMIWHTYTLIVPIQKWIIEMLYLIGSFIPCVYILHRERRKRMSKDFVVASKYLSISSYICIILGPIIVLTKAVYFWPGICYVVPSISQFFDKLQVASQEYFQLYRLYYCFSSDK